MTPVDLVLDRLEGVKQRGEGYQALCPAHDDHEPSLSVVEGEDGRALLKCFAGCETEDVLAALDLEMKDLFERRNGHGGGGVLYLPRNRINGSTPSRGVRTVNALKLYHDLKARGVILEAQGELLKVDAPAGVVTEADRAALSEFKPKLLKFLSRQRGEPQEGPERESVARWAGPGLVRIRDPFTAEWHEWPAAKCLPGVVAEADRRKKGDRCK